MFGVAAMKVKLKPNMVDKLKKFKGSAVGNKDSPLTSTPGTGLSKASRASLSTFSKKIAFDKKQSTMETNTFCTQVNKEHDFMFRTNETAEDP